MEMAPHFGTVEIAAIAGERIAVRLPPKELGDQDGGEGLLNRGGSIAQNVADDDGKSSILEPDAAVGVGILAKLDAHFGRCGAGL